MAKFEMDTDFIRKLAAILDETGLGEIELSDGERKIRLARSVAAPAQFTMAAPMAAGPAPAMAGPAIPPASAAGIHSTVINSLLFNRARHSALNPCRSINSPAPFASTSDGRR